MPSTVGIVASGEDVLNDAVFWVDAGRSSVSNGALTNLGTGGSALNAVFGNTTGVDSFDPALLTHTGTNYLYLPGATSNYASTPDTQELDITGDIDIQVRVALSTLTNHALVSKWSGGLSRAYVFYVGGDSNLYFETTPDGSFGARVTAGTTATISSAGVTAGTTVWLRVTRDVDNGSGSNVTAFYWAADSDSVPSLWTQIGSSVTKAGTTSIYAGIDRLTLGQSDSNNSNPLTGRFYRCIIRNGIGGTNVFDADFTTGITSGAQTTFTESSANAATVTINRATSGRKSVAVTRPILLFGTDDYLEVADNDLLDFGASDSFTAVAVVRQWGSPTFNAILTKKADNLATTAGYVLRLDGNSKPNVLVADAASSSSASPTAAISSGVIQVLSGIRNVALDQLFAGVNNGQSAGVTDTTTTTLANALPFRVGRYGTSTLYSDMELVAAAVWRRALNANEIATIVNRYT